MASKAVFDAVAARLTGTWNGIPVYYPNAKTRPPADLSTYIAVQFPVSNAEQGSFGSPGTNLIREEGAFRLVIHAPLNSGIDTALAYADALTTLFLNVSFGGVQTRVPTPPVIDDRNTDGGWYKVSLAVPYQYDAFVG